MSNNVFIYFITVNIPVTHDFLRPLFDTWPLFSAVWNEPCDKAIYNYCIILGTNGSSSILPIHSLCVLDVESNFSQTQGVGIFLIFLFKITMLGGGVISLTDAIEQKIIDCHLAYSSTMVVLAPGIYNLQERVNHSGGGGGAMGNWYND